MGTTAVKGTVYLVGAGPGDPELLTLRAARLIESADVIFHDDLVPEAILRLAGPETLVTSVGKRCGQPRITQEGIHRLMVQAAAGDQSVVRLKSGDPLVFGRAGEEIAALERAGIACEIVPGITAALAAGASLGLPLTDRNHASKLILLTGHHAPGKGAQTPLWTGTLPHDATLAIYMPGRDLAHLQEQLRAAGMAPETPVAAVSHAAGPMQSEVAGPLHAMHRLQPGPSPLLVLAGAAVARLQEPGDDASLASPGEAARRTADRLAPVPCGADDGC